MPNWIYALTLHEPFASLIAVEEKIIETRSWKPQIELPIRLAIHAGKSRESLRLAPPSMLETLKRYGREPVFGAVVCVVDVVDIEPTHRLRPVLDGKELSYGNYTPGRWGWWVEVVEIYPEPIPARGIQGLWKWHAYRRGEPVEGRHHAVHS